MAYEYKIPRTSRRGSPASIAYVDDKFANQEDWIVPSLGNSWVAYSASFETPSYMKDAMGFVHLKGLAKDGTPGSSSVMFTLPVNYRPLETQIYPVVSNNALGQLRIEENGNVVAYAGSGLWFSIEGITFRAER